MSRKHNFVLAAAVLAAGISLPQQLAPAYATSYSWHCNGVGVFAGHVDANNGATTDNQVADCGTMRVRIGYRIYQGSPVYWTGYSYGAQVANINSTNQIVSSDHGANSCQWPYDCGPFRLNV